MLQSNILSYNSNDLKFSPGLSKVFLDGSYLRIFGECFESFNVLPIFSNQALIMAPIAVLSYLSFVEIKESQVF